MKKIVLIIALLTSCVWAKDIKDFDIKGIKLGMSLTQVKKELNKFCPNFKLSKFKDQSKQINCDINNDYIIIHMGYNNKIYHISRTINNDYCFTDKDTQLIKSKFLSKYGKSTTSSNKNNKSFSYCWGIDCTVRDKVALPHDYKNMHPYLITEIFIYSSSMNKTDISFELYDASLKSQQEYDYKNSLKKSMVDRTKNLEFWSFILRYGRKLTCKSKLTCKLSPAVKTNYIKALKYYNNPLW